MVRIARRTFMLGVGASLSSRAIAQEWPTHPIKLLVPYAPGGVTDTVARIISAGLSDALKERVIVENKPGAGGLLGTEIAARSAPDGYTLLMFVDVNTMFPSTIKNIRHDPAAFEPITLLGYGPHVVVATPSLPVTDLKSLMAYAKSRPGELSAALPGQGGPQHLAFEMIRSYADLQIASVPYKGGGQAIVDVVSGQVGMGVLGLAPALPHIRAGRLRAIAVTSAKRSPALPDVPTVSESGIPGFETTQWQALVAPPGTPHAIIKRLHDEAIKVLADKNTVERLAALGIEAQGSPKSEDLAKMIKRELERWPPIIKRAGIRTE